MRRMVWVGSLSALGCTAALDVAPVSPGAQGSSGRRSIMVASSPAGPAAYVARRGGGAFLLAPDGNLTRLDRHGSESGRYATSLRTLFEVDAHVCGSARDGGTYCLLDRHEDLSCGADPAPPLLLPLEDAEQGAPHGKVHSGQAQLQVSCEQHCLAYPACSALRCLDPCPPGEMPHIRLVPSSRTNS